MTEVLTNCESNGWGTMILFQVITRSQNENKICTYCTMNKYLVFCFLNFAKIVNLI